MQQTAIIIDDFYADPLSVRAAALSLSYPEPKGQIYYPGRTSRERLLPPDTDEMFSFIVRENITGAEKSTHGCCRYSLAGAHRPAEIHIDPGKVWAGIVFLSLDKDCQGGTEFFRHKKFGTDRAPLTDEEARRVYGMATRHEVVRHLIHDDGHHLERWERVMVLPMRFNRCVLFRPWMWHTSGVDFGRTMEDGRLVQLLFFDAADPAGKLSAPEY